jgi:hypothetical protein
MLQIGQSSDHRLGNETNWREIPRGFNPKAIKRDINYHILRSSINSRLEEHETTRKNDKNILTTSDHTGTGGKFMRLKFDKMEVVDQPGKGGKVWKMCQVSGEQVDGKGAGEDRTMRFFVSAKDMYSAVKTFNQGDIIDVTMKQNGQYWNPTAFTKVEASEAAVDSKVEANVSGAVNPVAVPEASLRLATLKIAGDMAIQMGINGASELFELSESLIDYIKNGYDNGDLELPSDVDEATDPA